ncbi:MAG: terminase small subunit [Dehalococcoidia bacterium]|jgi:hypothetical protein
MKGDKLTPKQERFALNIFQGMTQRKAWVEAGYSGKYSMAVIDVNASRLATSTKVKLRLAELQNKADDAAITTVVERKRILSEIQRARFGDFTDDYGNLKIGDKQLLRSAAVQEIKTESTPLGYRTTLKLRDPVNAIAEHNKMDGSYAPERKQLDVTGEVLFVIGRGYQEGKCLPPSE